MPRPWPRVSPQRPVSLLLFFEQSAPPARHPALRGPESRGLGNHVTRGRRIPVLGLEGKGARAAGAGLPPILGSNELFTKTIALTS